MAQLEQLAQHEVHGPPVFDPAVRLQQPEVAPAVAFIHCLRQTLDADPGFSGSPLARQAESYLLSTFLMQLPHSHRPTLEASARRALMPRTVRRAQDFMRAHAGTPGTLVDLCSHLGVSARSLQNGFQNFRGTTPMAFLRALRLRHARERLRLADPASSTVTEIALTCGFGHMGEFGTLYKRTFGVTPRQTLLKKA